MTLIIQTTVAVYIICAAMYVTRRQRPEVPNIYNDSYQYYRIFYVIFALTLIIPQAFRYGYEDTNNYKGIFHSLPDNLNEAFEMFPDYKGWIFVQWCLRHISTNGQFLIIVCAIIFTICDMYFIKKYSKDTGLSLYMYFMLSFLSNCNGTRQAFAAVILMMAFPWIVNKKYVRYILLILILSTVHSSILYIIPLVFLFGGKRWNWGLVAFVVACVVFAVFPGPLNAIIGDVVDEDYSHYLEAYTRGANVMHVFIDGVPLVLGIIYHVKNRDNVGENRVIDVLINMQIIKFGFMVLATGMAQYARIGMYVRNCTVLIVPFLINQVFGEKYRRGIKYAAIVLYFLLYAYDIYTLNASSRFDRFYLDFSILSSWN